MASKSPRRRYPAFFEKAIPIALAIIALAILVLLIVILLVSLRVFPGPG
jgi:hypothetical protein